MKWVSIDKFASENEDNQTEITSFLPMHTNADAPGGQNKEWILWSQGKVVSFLVWMLWLTLGPL